MLVIEVYNQSGELVWMVEFSSINSEDLLFFLGDYNACEYRWFAYSPIPSACWN